jgi:hypothetical protein
MKFWNKSKEVRKRCWYKVNIKISHFAYVEIKRWCQHQSSNGKFYFTFTFEPWYFEKHSDAVLFSLKWG